ncbi:response regulator transcription factor [Chlorogloeopsis fritschii PCC 9212]|uniref:LuxR family transcriptional regulator n=1 Tax=Chlorogloeopsis fritschii PCC 6912 TaxID=211165 RepID=A0A433MY57_CHLFR|nr:response regulator transcription factor [Chlorogloeopsis fritschii]MBF2009154.1 response regulator transcription factor [Chlorogloeopsis fritschii C42_A2020_084]RUR73237.1 LuxR family transcriptional regulator [Chlorogloeopsis fritschii PCC 6912]
MNKDLLQPKLKIVLIDGHEICLSGTLKLVQSQYPDAKIITCKIAENALNQISIFQPDLVVMDICLPEKSGMMARTTTGIQLLRHLLNTYSKLNIVIQSEYIKKLVQLKTEIDSHKGGFTIADKSLSSREMLTRVSWALQGLTHLKDIQTTYFQSELKPELVKLLTLAFQEGLQDKAIAQEISVSERMVRHYWDRLQNLLGIDCQELKNQGKNVRVVTQIRAREAGLID